ncbi:MAG: tyrosine recombinase XerC [Oscillospiraceae bacterium]|nr:tyrosine recombinase XerC [Oscillospiraceae bacterium]
MTENKFHDAPKPLRDFLFYMLTIRGRSPRTVDAYYTDLRTFLRYLKTKAGKQGEHTDISNVSIADINAEALKKVSLSDVYDFLNYTMTERENGAKARARKVSSLRTFFNYLTVKEHLLEDNPLKHLELPSVKKTLPKHLTLEESIELMAAVDTKFPRRDYCILTLFLNCGMRLSELVGINLLDVRLGEGTVKILGKGSKERIAYLNEACVFAIEQHLQERAEIMGAAKEKALFLSSRGRRISPRRVEQIVAQCLKAAGLEGQGYSPHKLRHTAATLLYQHGQVDIRVLKEILGHANLATTELYTHVSNKQIESAVHKSPLAGVKIKKKKSEF